MTQPARARLATLASRPSLEGRARRVIAIGAACAIAVALAGVAIELWWLGRTSAATVARIEAEVRRDVSIALTALRATARRLSTHETMLGGLDSAPPIDRALFEAVRREADRSRPEDLAITVYGPGAMARAWSGQPVSLPPERVMGPAACFVLTQLTELRLACVEPILSADGPPDGPRSRWIGSVVAERLLSAAPAGDTMVDGFELATAVMEVVVRPATPPSEASPEAFGFRIASDTGEPLLAVSVSPSQVTAVREAWRRRVWGVTLAIVALIALLLTGPLLDRRWAVRDAPAYLGVWLRLAGLVLAARGLLWYGLPLEWRGAPLGEGTALAWPAVTLATPVDFLLSALTVVAITALVADAVIRWRPGARHVWGAPQRHANADRRFLAHQVATGLAGVLVLAAYLAFLRDATSVAGFDLARFSLHPWDADRLAVIAAVLIYHAAVAWLIVVMLTAGLVGWRFSRWPPRLAGVIAMGWLVPFGSVVAGGALAGWTLPLPHVAPVLVAAMLAAYGHRRWLARYRHGSQGLRYAALFVALLAPAVLFYPSTLALRADAQRQIMATEYAPQVTDHALRLPDRLERALVEIDEALARWDAVEADAESMRAESAFLLWRRTELARLGIMSSIEIYDANRQLVSRFTLNDPADTEEFVDPPAVADCRWRVLAEPDVKGLHAERALCGTEAHPGAATGTIVVHATGDYRALSFIASQSPYLELFREPRAPQEARLGSKVELVIYAWATRRPTFTPRGGAWLLDDALFERLRGSREPFWATLEREGVAYDVYLFNDSNGIYALGRPSLTWFDVLLDLAELATLVAIGYVIALALSALVWGGIRVAPPAGRSLWREIRASFYRKLFLAFVAVAVIPVLTLAILVRTYFATQIRADVEAEGARSAAVARRVVEVITSLPLADGGATVPVTDEVMVWISQAIDHDINVFEGAELLATSERELFAAGLLPGRLPGDVYRNTVLEGRPSFVREDAIGDYAYMLATTPVSVGGREAVLTVPLTLRRREIDTEIDELDRRLHLGAVLFILVGAALGLSMAQRIADPVKRLTRVTQRIARGDFDVRVAVRSADELRRLVDAFNGMAAELKEQRRQLERTHRLEAWAEMARQVAHEIKNPLTPIQLSAEHLRQVNLDKGQPLSPVLDGCIDAILSQVRLLRQISGEFSSFASSPTARPVAVHLAGLLDEVVAPYRVALDGRVSIRLTADEPLPTLYLDRHLLGRAITNVLENALHAMPRGGGIEIGARSDDDQVVVTVADTGVGMEPEAIARVFEPYFSTRSSGTGLGLTIAKRNVELCGGTIGVSSAKGRGTTVTVRLPRPDPARAGTPDGP